MVLNTENNNQPLEKKPITDLPAGRYRLVGWDIDTTGRRLIDEICQIAAYTPNSNFAQYIMPYAGLNPLAQRRHNIRVITVSRYRMLKDLKTNKFLKTKSEISGLIDFLTWLEKNRGDGNDGIILVFHEIRKMAPAMLLEALKRYNLQDRFAAVVKGFANSYELAESKCAQTMKSFSLKVLSRVLLDKEEELDNAADRARLCYLVIQHLGQGERQDLEAEGSGDTGITERHAAELMHQYSRSLASEDKELADLKVLLERQNTFRPVFKELMSSNYLNRRHASRLRRLLAQNDLDYNKLKDAFENGGKQSIENLLKMISSANEKEYEELLEILDCYFDPDKKPVQPKPWPHRKNSRSQKDIKPNTSSKATSSSETSANAYNSDAGSPESVATPRSETQVAFDSAPVAVDSAPIAVTAAQ